MRMPTVSSPAQTSSASLGPRGSTMVRGPGQKAAASLRALSGMAGTRSSIMSMVSMWTMRGLSWGRPLAAKILVTALPQNALAAMP